MSAQMAVPAFVWSGMESLFIDDELDISARYTSEADIRDAIATAWWLHGADVRTEVKVPDCGRIDVLVTLGNAVRIVEVKKHITTATEARQAFQQANAYLSYVDAEAPSSPRRETHAVVVAATYDFSVTLKAERAFSGVTGNTWWDEIEDAATARTYYAHDTAAATANTRARKAAIDGLSRWLRRAEISLTTHIEDKALRNLESA